MRAEALSPLVGDLRQAASVRRIVLDDGPEKGVEALAFSTGGGLDFWVLAGRSLDIGPLWWRGAQLGWQSPGGFVNPALVDADSEGGRGFERGFSGFLVTCGLDHIRQPANGQPLHGRLPFTPARVTACGEDWQREEPVLFCEGEVTQARLGHEALRLRRRIEAPIGGASLRIRDRVTNLATEPCPQAMLYHFNLGYPALRSGTVVGFAGERLLGPLTVPDADSEIIRSVHPVAQCEPARAVVSSGGDDPLEVGFTFDASSLPWLQLWCDPSPHCGVLAIEPCTSERTDEGLSGREAPLKPGGRRTYSVEVDFSGLPPSIDAN